MDVFDRIFVEGYEQVAFCHDAPSGLQAIIAIHSTVLGPALGGTRFRPYATEDDAVADVCRLARGMTYKHAVSGLDCGGGKAVILGDPGAQRSEAAAAGLRPLRRRPGRPLPDRRGRGHHPGRHGPHPAGDALRHRRQRVARRLGRPLARDRLGRAVAALRTVGRRVWGSPSLADRHVVVVGVGKVGRALVAHLVDEGARVTVADVDPAASRRS